MANMSSFVLGHVLSKVFASVLVEFCNKGYDLSTSVTSYGNRSYAKAENCLALRLRLTIPSNLELAAK